MDNKLELNITEDLDKIKNDIAGTTTVSETQVEESLDYNKLNDQEKTAIDEFVEKIDEKDTNMIISFGAPAQTKIAKFLLYQIQNLRKLAFYLALLQKRLLELRQN